MSLLFTLVSCSRRNKTVYFSTVLWIRIRRIHMFLASRIRIRRYFVWILIRILPSTSNKSKKNFDFLYFATSI